MTICVFPAGKNSCPACGLYTPDTSRPRNCKGERVVASDGPSSQGDFGPGTELKALLAGWPFYITSAPDCSCNRVAREMDSWGPDECETPERMDYVLTALRENAEKRGLPFVDAVVGS